MLTLHAFNGLTGAHVCRLPAVKASWSDAINEHGSIDATVLDDGTIPSTALRQWGTIIAVVDEDTVLHAGYLTHAKLDRANSQWTLEAGGGGTILEKRLVLNYALNSSWTDGQVLIDEDNPSGNWPLTLTGSYSDIISGLVTETKKWGTLPITAATLTGGNKTRTYNSYDFATVSDRIRDIGELEYGPEWRFDPVLSSSWVISFTQKTSADGGELKDSTWKWNAIAPQSGVLLDDEDIDGSDMSTSCYASGGKSDDMLLVARYSSSTLTGAGWPLLQTSNKTHNDVSVLSTLQSYARRDIMAGDDPQRTIGLKVSRSMYDVHVGDWVTLRYGTGNADVIQLKVTDLKGSTDTDMLTVGTRERT